MSSSAVLAWSYLSSRQRWTRQHVTYEGCLHPSVSSSAIIAWYYLSSCQCCMDTTARDTRYDIFCIRYLFLCPPGTSVSLSPLYKIIYGLSLSTDNHIVLSHFSFLSKITFELVSNYGSNLTQNNYAVF